MNSSEENITHKSMPVKKRKHETISIISSSTSSVEDDEEPKLITDLLPHQVKAVTWMKEKESLPIPEKGSLGGIVADDMGLGKTLDCIALMMSGEERTMMNLIIAPLSLLVQWKQEILNHTTMKENHILIYHKKKSKEQLENIFDDDDGKQKGCFIVLTTYDIVRKECGEKGLLFQQQWYRIILDEAQVIKNLKRATAESICRLKSKRRWAVTGTPYNNNIFNLASLFKFVDIYPLNTTLWWQSNEHNYKAVQNILSQHVIMRKKVNILSLPSKTIHLVPVRFSISEREVYNWIFKKALDTYRQYINSDEQQLSTLLGWTTILREICNHPGLVIGRSWSRRYAIKSLSPQLNYKKVCVDCQRKEKKKRKAAIGDFELLQCSRHYKCLVCYGRPQKDASFCKICQRLSEWIDPPKESSKIEKLFEILKTRIFYNQETIETSAVVIFSQFTGTLDVVEHFLNEHAKNEKTEEDIKYGKVFSQYVRYDGNIINMDARNEVVREFIRNPQMKIILVSLKSGGVGLNLIKANHVIMFDSWYNPFAEDQAIDRVHRIGQTKPVNVWRMIMENSIENDVENIQRKKREAAQSYFSKFSTTPPSNLVDEYVSSSSTIASTLASTQQLDIHALFRHYIRQVKITSIKNTKINQEDDYSIITAIKEEDDEL